MDANLMSCPSCGHAVSSTAGACAYCGATIAGGGVKEQTAEEISGEETLATVSEPPVPPAEMPPAAGMYEETGNTMAASEKPSESIHVQQTPAEPVAADSDEPAAEWDTYPVDTADQATTEPEAATPDSQTSGRLEDSMSNADSVSAEAVESEVVSMSVPTTAPNLAPEDVARPEAESRASDGELPTVEEQMPAEGGPEEEALPSPAPEVVELTAEEHDEAETLGAEIVEMVETSADKDEDHAQQSKADEDTSSLEEIVEQMPEKLADDPLPTETPTNDTEETVELTSEALGETILLEAVDEVQTPVKGISGKGEEAKKTAAAKPKEAAETGPGADSMKSKLQQDVLKIEKAAGEMAAAIKKQKARLDVTDNLKDSKAHSAKVQELKQQKAALAKQQAKKKQKLLLAKAAALKRKKAAEAKALALNKQHEAAAVSKGPNQEQAAAAGPGQKAAPPAAAGLELKSRMQALLNKYEGQAIGINYDNSAEIREALLEDINSEYFSVFVKDKQLHYSYPLKTILAVIEGKDGVESGTSKPPQKFKAVVKVYPLVLF